MSRRRSSLTSDDSLELLLDTISNVFGAIILMAILVVIQLTTTSVRIPKQDPNAEQRALSGKELQFELKRLTHELSGLKQDLANLPKPPGSSNATTLMERKEAFVAAIKKATERLRAAEGQEPDAGAAKKQIDQDMAQVSADLKKKQAELREVKRTGAVQLSPHKKVRLPYRHKRNPRLAQRQFIVKDGRIWPLPETTTKSRWQRTNGTLHVERGEGIPVLDADDLQPVLDQMRLRSPRSHFVSFWVCRGDDSFKAFQRVRALFVERGYEYSVGTYKRNPGLILYSGSPEVE